MRLVIAGAHAMDAELMAGCLAAAAADAGWDVVLLHLTLGERGHPDRPPHEFGRQLEREATAAGRILGARVGLWDLPAPLELDSAIAWLVGQLRMLAPDLVVGHWSGSWHPSHRRAHEAVREALAAIGSDAPLAFGENCEDLTGFRASHYLPAVGVRERYLEAAASYELFRRSVPGSGVPADIPYWAYYSATLRVRGLQFGCDQAQAFMAAGSPIPAGLDLLEALQGS